MVCQEQPSDQVQQLYQEAKLAEQAGQTDQAIQKYKEIIKLDPKLAAGYNNLGGSTIRKGSSTKRFSPSGVPASSIRKWSLPAPSWVLFFQLEDFEGARRELKLAAQLNPADKTARLFLARSLVELKDFAGALEILERAANARIPKIVRSFIHWAASTPAWRKSPSQIQDVGSKLLSYWNFYWERFRRSNRLLRTPPNITSVRLNVRSGCTGSLL